MLLILEREEVVLLDGVPEGRQHAGDGQEFRGLPGNEGVSISEGNREWAELEEGGQGIGWNHGNVEQNGGIVSIK